MFGGSSKGGCFHAPATEADRGLDGHWSPLVDMGKPKVKHDQRVQDAVGVRFLLVEWKLALNYVCVMCV